LRFAVMPVGDAAAAGYRHVTRERQRGVCPIWSCSR